MNLFAQVTSPGSTCSVPEDTFPNFLQLFCIAMKFLLKLHDAILRAKPEPWLLLSRKAALQQNKLHCVANVILQAIHESLYCLLSANIYMYKYIYVGFFLQVLPG